MIEYMSALAKDCIKGCHSEVQYIQVLALQMDAMYPP